MREGKKYKFNVNKSITTKGQGAFATNKDAHFDVKQSPFQKRAPKFDPNAVKPMRTPKAKFGRDSMTTPVRSPKVRSY